MCGDNTNSHGHTDTAQLYYCGFIITVTCGIVYQTYVFTQQKGKRRVFEALLAEQKAKEEELKRIKQEEKMSKAEELEVRRIQADKKRARLLEPAEKLAEASERKRHREEQAVKKQEEREER